MKRFMFPLSMMISLCLFVPVFGQEAYFGLTGGMNIADMKMTGDGVEQDVDRRNLMGAGGVFGVRFGDHFSLQLRPLYLQKGGTLDQAYPSPDIDFNLSFLQFDVSVKAAVGNRIRPYIMAGPSLGFLLTAEVETEVAGTVLKADVMDVSKKTEYGLGIGAGVELALWKGFLFVEGRYAIGLNNLSKGGTVELKVDGVVADTEEIGPDDQYKNRGFEIMAGYSFPLSKK
jgi:opacity protein-like surface antigen